MSTGLIFALVAVFLGAGVAIFAATLAAKQAKRGQDARDGGVSQSSDTGSSDCGTTSADCGGGD